MGMHLDHADDSEHSHQEGERSLNGMVPQAIIHCFPHKMERAKGGQSPSTAIATIADSMGTC